MWHLVVYIKENHILRKTWEIWEVLWKESDLPTVIHTSLSSAIFFPYFPCFGCVDIALDIFLYSLR